MDVAIKPPNFTCALSNIKPSGLFWVISTSSGNPERVSRFECSRDAERGAFLTGAVLQWLLTAGYPNCLCN